ncbi:MAG TPA: hypothetical protein VML75_02790, partial [Kofleriaceae bacterium]|nr:hypothetical protein [Kofleriaceae bacterium]
GQAGPEAYVEIRADAGLEVIAVADHDTFAGVARADLEARARGLVLVPAMEVTSHIHFGTEDAEQIHILAYFPPSMLADGSLEQSSLARRAADLHRRWRDHVLGWVEELPAWEREALDPDSLRALTGAAFPALQSMIDLVHARNRLLSTLFHAHHRHFWDDPALFGWSPEQAIEQIRADGALDVVAHPGRVRDKARMDRVLDYAAGIEVYTSRHRDNVAAAFRARAEADGKHWTASTDDHQRAAYAPPPHGTPRATVERIVDGDHCREVTAVA